MRLARESVCTRHDTTRSLISINKYPLCLGQNREQLSTTGLLNAYAVFHIGDRNKRKSILSLIDFYRWIYEERLDHSDTKIIYDRINLL